MARSRTQPGAMLQAGDCSRSLETPLSHILACQDEIPHGNLGVKIAPGINYQALPAQSETQWISVGGELVEAGIWLGDLISQQGRSALLMDKSGKIVTVLHDETAAPCNTPAELSETIATEDELGEWILNLMTQSSGRDCWLKLQIKHTQKLYREKSPI